MCSSMKTPQWPQMMLLLKCKALFLVCSCIEMVTITISNFENLFPFSSSYTSSFDFTFLYSMIVS